jgi:DNA-binding SARP family transcriptional activator
MTAEQEMRVATDRVRVALLGRFEVFINDQPTDARHWRHTHPRMLMQALCLAPNFQLPRDTLAGWLWADANDEAASNRLYHTVHVLRRALTSTGLPLPASCLEVSGGVVHLCSDIDWRCDVLELFELVDQARRNEDAAQFADLLAQADALYRGELPALPDAEALRPRRDELARAALWVREQRAIAAKDDPAAIVAWQRVLELQPYNESAHCRIIECWLRGGQQGRAREQYEACRIALERMGLTPSSQTKRLLKAEPPARDDASLPIIGRSKELSLLRRWFIDEGARLVTITGEAGVGKTRLALELMRQCTPHFADGAVFVSLSTADDGSFWTRLCAACDVPASHDAMAALEQHWRERHGLLVLDRIEHLVAHADALQSLLETCPRLQIATTGQRALQCAVERTIELTTDGLEAAAQLFRTILMAHGAKTDTGRDEPHAVEQLCERLRHNALAVTMAARTAASNTGPSLETLAAQGCHPLRNKQADEPQHASMQAAGRWCLSLLQPVELLALEQIRGLPGEGWSVEHAQAAIDVAGMPADSLAVLLALRRMHLIVETEPNAQDSAPRRLRTATVIQEHLGGAGLPVVR